ncbi:MAG: SLC13 family permease [Caldilineaceae bacterium]
MMVPVLLSLSAQLRLRPSKLLIPLSYFSILGGTMTLLGTSTNILLDDLYRKAGGPAPASSTFCPSA